MTRKVSRREGREVREERKGKAGRILTAREKHMLMASAPAVASSKREALDIFMPVCVCLFVCACVRVG